MVRRWFCYSMKQENPLPALAQLSRSTSKTLKKTSRKFYGYIWYSKLHNFRKNRKLWKFLEPTIKNFRKLAAAVQKMGKIIRSNIVWLAYQQSKIFKKFKANGKFVNVVNQVLFGYIWYSKLHTFSFHENKDWAFWNLYSFCITLVARHINKLRKLNWHLK